VKKILVLAETIDANSSSAGKGRSAFISSLYSAGYSVKVYHYSGDEVLIENVKTFQITESKLSHNYILSRSQRVFQRFSGINFSKSLEKLFGFSFSFKSDVSSLIKGLQEESPGNYDMILTLSKGASYRTHAAILKMPRWHNIWMAYIHDPYPFHWYPHPYYWKESGANMKEDFFRQVAINAKWLGYPSLLLADWMGKFHPDFRSKAVILPHQLPANRIILKAQQNETETIFSISHIGTLLKQRDPVPLMYAWKKFMKDKKDTSSFQLNLIGPSDYHQENIASIIANDSSIHFHPEAIFYEKAQSIERASTANIILEAIADHSPFLPGKFPSLVLADKPILHLGPQHSETVRLLGNDYPYHCAANDINQIMVLLEMLYQRWLKSGKHLQLNRPDLIEYLSSHALASEIEKLEI
jgi:hypothetical protein